MPKLYHIYVENIGNSYWS